MDEKRAHTGWLCSVTDKSVQVTMNRLDIHASLVVFMVTYALSAETFHGNVCTHSCWLPCITRNNLNTCL
jgi:hypothetical protein